MTNDIASILVEATPLDSMELAYRITLPRDWKAQQVEVAVSRLQTDRSIPLGIFDGVVAGAAVVLSIAAMRLSRPVFAADWLKGYGVSHGHTLLDIHSNAADSTVGVSSFMVGTQEQQSVLRVVLDGDRLFFVQCFVGKSQFAALPLQDIVESFDLLHPVGPPSFDALAGQCGAASFTLLGPWLTRPLGSTDPRATAVDYFSSYVNGAVNCWARVKFRQSKTIPKLEVDMAALGQDLRGANVVFIKTLRQEPIPAKLGFLEGGLIRVLSGYPQDHAANTMEVTCLALSSGAVAVSGFFLFPSDTVDYLAWAQGRRSIAAFLSTLRVHG